MSSLLIPKSILRRVLRCYTSLESLESPHGIIALSIWPCCEALQELLCVGPKAIRRCCMVLLGSWHGVAVGKGRTGRLSHSW